MGNKIEKLRDALPEIDDSWKEAELSSLWFIKLLDTIGYSAKPGKYTFRTESRTRSSHGAPREDFTLLCEGTALIHIELKRPRLRLEPGNLDFEHFKQAHKYAVSHYVCRRDRYITPLGVLTNGHYAYVFDGSIESPNKAFERSARFDLDSNGQFQTFLSYLDPATAFAEGLLKPNSIISSSVQERNRTPVQGADTWLSKRLTSLYDELSKCLASREAFTATVTFFLTAVLRDCGYIPTEELRDFEARHDWDGLIATLATHIQSNLSALRIPEKKHKEAFSYYEQTKWLPVYLDVFPADCLGRAYEDLLHHVKGNAARTSYYTPRWLIDEILSELKISKNHRILDPCTGSSGFLTSCVERCFPLGAKHNIAEIKSYIENKLVGIDKDWYAVQVSKAALTAIYARYLPDEASFRAPKTKIIECDFFEAGDKVAEVRRKFDKIVGNPPWGNHEEWLDERFHEYARTLKAYQRVACVSVLVFDEACKYLAKDGQIGLVIKHEVLDGAAHGSFRKFLSKISGRIWDYGRRKIFTNSSQTIVVYGQADKPGPVTIIPKDPTALRQEFEYEGTPMQEAFNLHQGFQVGLQEIYFSLAEKFPMDKNVRTLVSSGGLEPFSYNGERIYFIEGDADVPKSVSSHCKKTKMKIRLRKSKARNQAEAKEVTETIQGILHSRAQLKRTGEKSLRWLWLHDYKSFKAAEFKIIAPYFLSERTRINAVGIYDAKTICKQDTTVYLPADPTMTIEYFKYCLGFMNSRIGYKIMYNTCKQAGGTTVASFPEYAGLVKIPKATSAEVDLTARIVNLIEKGHHEFLPVLDEVFTDLVTKGKVSFRVEERMAKIS